MLPGSSIPEDCPSYISSSHWKRKSFRLGARSVVDDTQVPRVLRSQGLYIQSPFLLKSSERHMTSHELVSESIVYGCSETVNETFCFFYLYIWFYMVQNIPGLSIHKGQKREFDEALDELQICLSSSIVLLTATSSNFILTLKELEKWMLRFYWSTFHTWMKNKSILSKKRIFMDTSQ